MSAAAVDKNHQITAIEPSVVYLLEDLPGDLKRMLRVQFKEFVHVLDEQLRWPKQPGLAPGKASQKLA